MARQLNPEDRPHPKQMQTTYYLKEILYVPHYRIPGVYVAPGGLNTTQQELRMKGAVAAMQSLWTRGFM